MLFHSSLYAGAKPPSLPVIYNKYSPLHMWSAENISEYSTKNALTVVTDEYVNFDNVLTAVASQTTGTISTWVYLPDVIAGVTHRLITFGDTDANEFLVFQIDTLGRFVVALGIAGTTQWNIRSTFAIDTTDGNWVHLLVAHDGVKPNLFVNGVDISTIWAVDVDRTKWFTDCTGLDNGRLGCLNYNSGGNTEFFDGKFGDILITSDAKNAAAVTDIYNNGFPKDEGSISNAIVYYRFDNASDNYNSDVVNEWRFYDEISSITADSVNCEVGDIAETEITSHVVLYDYAGTHDLSSHGWNYPTIQYDDSNYKGRQTFKFNGTSTGFNKNFSDFRSGDNVGMITYICTPNDDLIYAFSTADKSSNNRYFIGGGTGSSNFGRIRSINGTSTINNFQNTQPRGYPKMICTVLSDGVNFKIWVNGIEQSTATITADGQWLNDMVAGELDNISIGFSNQSTESFASMDWALTMYHDSVLSDADLRSMHQDIMKYYGMDFEVAISEIVNTYSTHNMWNANMSFVDGTTTTLFDILGKYDMANPAAANQPTFTTSDVDFNNESSITFVDAGTDYLENSVANYGSTLGTTGVFTVVCKITDLSATNILYSVVDVATNTERHLGAVTTSGNARVLYNKDGAGVFFRDATTTTITAGNTYIMSFMQKGASTLAVIINGVNEVMSGSSTGDWLDDYTVSDAIQMGAKVNSAATYSPDVEMAYMDYAPYTDVATVQNLHTKLNKIYNIY